MVRFSILFSPFWCFFFNCGGVFFWGVLGGGVITSCRVRFTWLRCFDATLWTFFLDDDDDGGGNAAADDDDDHDGDDDGGDGDDDDDVDDDDDGGNADDDDGVDDDDDGGNADDDDGVDDDDGGNADDDGDDDDDGIDDDGDDNDDDDGDGDDDDGDGDGDDDDGDDGDDDDGDDGDDAQKMNGVLSCGQKNRILCSQFHWFLSWQYFPQWNYAWNMWNQRPSLKRSGIAWFKQHWIIENAILHHGRLWAVDLVHTPYAFTFFLLSIQYMDFMIPTYPNWLPCLDTLWKLPCIKRYTNTFHQRFVLGGI